MRAWRRSSCGHGTRLERVYPAVVDGQPSCRVGVVPDDGAARAAEHRCPDLGRAQPVHVHVREGSVRQPHRQVAPGRPGRPRSGSPTWAATADRGDVLGKHEVQDRQVMRREVPEDVDVGLHQAKVDPDRVDELDVAYLPAADELADALDSRGVAVRVVAHEHQAPSGARARPASLPRRRTGSAASPPVRACRPPGHCAQDRSGSRRVSRWRPRRRAGR